MEVVSFLNEGLPVLIGMEHEKRENLCLNFPEVAEVATGLMSSEFSVKPYEIEVVPENLAQQCVLGAIEVDKFHFLDVNIFQYLYQRYKNEITNIFLLYQEYTF